MTEQLTWKRRLDKARQCPQLWTSRARDGHVILGVRDPLRLVWDKGVFGPPRDATVRVSPLQYHTVCRASPLVSALATVVAWSDCDNLILAINGLTKQVAWEIRNAWKLTGSTFAFGSFTAPLELAHQGLVGIRIEDTLWCQAFREGWPVTPPTPIPAEPSGASLMVAAWLNPEHFRYVSLPFTREAVLEKLPEASRGQVTVEWHEQNDLFGLPGDGAQCLCNPEQMRRWVFRD